MQVSERQSDLSRIKLCFRFRKALALRQVLEQLSTLNELHDEVDTISFLEHVVHADNEGMIHLVQDELLDLQ